MTETAKKEIPSGEDSPCLPAGTSRPTFSEVVNRWKEGVGIRTRGNFETIVRRWAGKGPKAPMPEYRHEEISEFYRDVLQRVSFDSSEVRAMETVLKFLDENGDCSSLTTQHPGERERTVAPFVREIYAQVPLWQHTLNVAREALRIQGGHPDEQPFAPAVDRYRRCGPQGGNETGHGNIETDCVGIRTARCCNSQ